jgi:hypothetical protein
MYNFLHFYHNFLDKKQEHKKFYIYPSPPLNENKLVQLARHVSI